MQAAIVSSPQLPRHYMDDCRPFFDTADVTDIQPGVCRDSTGAVDIVSPVAVPVDMTASGAGGLDTGARAAQTNYAIYLIANTSTGAVDGLASLDFVTPLLPTGFNVFRRVGAVSLNSASGIRPFFSVWPGRIRWITWNLTQGAISDTSCRALNNGAATVSTAIGTANRFFFPTTATIRALATFVSANVGTAGQLGPTGVTAILNEIAVIAQVAAVAAQDRGFVTNVGSGSPRTISYQVPNGADQFSVWIQGCDDVC